MRLRGLAFVDSLTSKSQGQGISDAKIKPILTKGHKMDSPCIASCKLNSDKICVGCYRHIEEIVDWNKRSEAEQLQIMANLALRKSKVDGQASQETSAITQSEWQEAKSRLALQRKIRLE